MSTSPTPRAIEDHYTVERKIGEGASAETFLARDADGDRVVIKSLHVEKLDGWKFFELFEREAQTLAGLDHAGVPKFVEWFASKTDEDRPRFHIVQEYIEGRPLEEIIDSGGMSAAEFDQLALGMLDILYYLHSRTPPVYHRDIKPSNIIVREMGAPVLVDFGSVTTGWREEDERGSTVAGTHGYMPPEQYMGQVSAKSDLYGLGATLLHVVSGRAPSEFSFDDGRISVPEELTLRPSVRRALDAMLEPAPRDRPESAKAARDILVAQETALVPVSSAQTAMVRSDEPVRALRVENAPDFVDLGPPPRDPNGEFRDVYRSLVPPFTAVHTGAEGVNRAAHQVALPLQLMLFLLLFASTFGLWPVIKLLGRKDRVRRGELFRNGIFTECVVVNVAAQNQASSRVAYEFEVDGERVRTSELVINSDSSHMLPGDRYGALYDPDDPSVNTIVYR